MAPHPPVHTAALFAPLHAELIALLRGLTREQWESPTVAGAWRVRDVAGHMLDVDLRNIAGKRDAHRSRSASGRSLSTFEEIVDFINAENASGVAYADRLSPRLLTDLLEVTGRWASDLMASLPPDDEARIAVAWADEDRSANWMDVGREYTERWHHQMQIRDAVSAPGLLERRWLEPLLALSVLAFRRAYKHVTAPPGTAVLFEVAADDADYAWTITREGSGWNVERGRAVHPAARVRTDAPTAWKLLYNAVPPDAAASRVTVTGNAALAEPIIRTRSVMV